MSKKKILVINPGNLYPVRMAFQDRVVNLAQVLNQSHYVHVIALYNSDEQKAMQEKHLPEICEKYHLIPKPNRTFLQKKCYGLIKKGLKTCFNVPGQTVYPNWPSVKKEIRSIINNGNYDIVQIETWWQCNLFKFVDQDTYKVIDTHDVMYEKRELEKSHQNKTLTAKDQSFLHNYKTKELESTALADLIISISEHDLTVFKNHFPEKEHILVPIGQDISEYVNYPHNDDGKTILFYGSMGGKQNTLGFWRLYNKILPEITKQKPDVRLIVLGANPPADIAKLHDGKQVIVTGFVSDVREYISRSTLMILPLETSGGFRGRIVEVMGMGVPVIGTHNALGCINMTNGIHGYLTDDNRKMAECAIQILNDRQGREKMQSACRQFIKDNYSIANTYEKLSKYYLDL